MSNGKNIIVFVVLTRKLFKSVRGGRRDVLQCHAESHLMEGSCQLNFYHCNSYNPNKALGTCGHGEEQRRDRIFPFRPDPTGGSFPLFWPHHLSTWCVSGSRAVGWVLHQDLSIIMLISLLQALIAIRLRSLSSVGEGNPLLQGWGGEGRSAPSSPREPSCPEDQVVSEEVVHVKS